MRAGPDVISMHRKQDMLSDTMSPTKEGGVIMLFFRLSGTTTGAKEIGNMRDNIKTNTYNQKHQQSGYLFVSSISEDSVSVGIISRRTSAVDSLISSYLKAIGVTLLHTSVDEITLAGMKSMLRNADRGGFIDDDDEVLERFGLDSIGQRFLMYSEDVIADPVNGHAYNLEDKNRLYEQTERLLMRESMNDELFRIYMLRSSSAAASARIMRYSFSRV